MGIPSVAQSLSVRFLELRFCRLLCHGHPTDRSSGPVPLLEGLALKLVCIPDGAEVLSSLNATISASGFMPAAIFCALGHIRDTHLRVPIDAALEADILAEDAEPFDVPLTPEGWTPFSDGRKVALPSTPIEGPLPRVDLRPRPHWYTDEVHAGPLRLLYALGGMSGRRPDSRPNYHLFISGNESRPGGRSETYVGQLRPGTLVHKYLWVAFGFESAHYKGSNVDMFALSIDPGQDVIEVLHRFLASPRAQDIGRCFVFSAIGALSSARFRVPLESDLSISEDSTAKPPVFSEGGGVYKLEELQGEDGYFIESITAVFGGDIETPIVHAAVVLPPVEGELKRLSLKGESVGGELLEAIVGGDQPLDFVVGEVYEEFRDFVFG